MKTYNQYLFQNTVTGTFSLFPVDNIHKTSPEFKYIGEMNDISYKSTKSYKNMATMNSKLRATNESLEFHIRQQSTL
jgi:hypothetical protein